MILHTINKPAALADCAPLISETDTVVLIEDGAYLVGEPLPCSICVLGQDLTARGLKERVPDNVQIIDYRRLVQLCAEADKVCAWF